MIDYHEREREALQKALRTIPQELTRNRVKGDGGGFVQLFKNDDVHPKYLMACAIDGVGTKLVLAEAMNRFDTVGIDCVAMSANDMACLGAVSPFLYLSYVACQEKIQTEGILPDLIEGVVQGLERCNLGHLPHVPWSVNLGKGETASVDELLSSTRPGYGFDLAGALIGFVRKGGARPSVKAGNRIIGLGSSGPHSNGYTFLRHLLLDGTFESRPDARARYFGRFNLNDPVPGGFKTFGEALLAPTTIYSVFMSKATEQYPSIQGVNNTGHGLKNLNRVADNKEFRLMDLPNYQPLFRVVESVSPVPRKELYEKLNMGWGFFVICEEKQVDSLIQLAKEEKIGAKEVGEVRDRDGQTCTVLESEGEELVFEGY